MNIVQILVLCTLQIFAHYKYVATTLKTKLLCIHYVQLGNTEYCTYFIFEHEVSTIVHRNKPCVFVFCNI